ncbi:MAG TPA: hypothetical protein VF713_14500 [Thermoanaerobaculia bacterium]
MAKFTQREDSVQRLAARRVYDRDVNASTTIRERLVSIGGRRGMHGPTGPALDRSPQRFRDLAGNVVLNHQRVVERAVVGFGASDQTT